MLYKDSAAIADEEGFPQVAFQFRKISEIESEHEKRYRKLLANIESGQVFKKDAPVRWKCRNCGYVHTGDAPPEKCPACEHPKAYFEVKAENY